MLKSSDELLIELRRQRALLAHQQLQIVRNQRELAILTDDLDDLISFLSERQRSRLDQLDQL